MKKLIIYGVGDFASTLTNYISSESAFEVVAYSVDDEYLDGKKHFDGKPLYGLSEIVRKYSYSEHSIMLAIGYSSMRARVSMFENAMKTGLKIENFISKNSIVHPSVKYGVGNIILPGSIVEPCVSIGDNNIIWSSVNISHDSKIGCHNFIATQSLIGGFSKVGDSCFLGFKSTISQNVSLGDETLLGACSLVLKDTLDYGKYVGVPARLVSTHKEKGITIK